MLNDENFILPLPKRTPWNKGKPIGPKPPLQQRHVWAIRTKLQIEQRTRDPAMFNLAIDSKLRGCDVVALRVEDVAPNGYAVDRATVRQKKTGRPGGTCWRAVCVYEANAKLGFQTTVESWNSTQTTSPRAAWSVATSTKPASRSNRIRTSSIAIARIS
jgi:hypothetical protein